MKSSEDSPPAPQFQCWGHIQDTATEARDKKKKGEQQSNGMVPNIEIGGAGGERQQEPSPTMLQYFFCLPSGISLFH